MDAKIVPQLLQEQHPHSPSPISSNTIAFVTALLIMDWTVRMNSIKGVIGRRSPMPPHPQADLRISHVELLQIWYQHKFAVSVG